MDEKTWHDTWIATLVGNGFSQRQAHHIFFVCYGNQELNLGKDPVSDASMFLPAPEDDSFLLEGEEPACGHPEQEKTQDAGRPAQRDMRARGSRPKLFGFLRHLGHDPQSEGCLS